MGVTSRFTNTLAILNRTECSPDDVSDSSRIEYQLSYSEPASVFECRPLNDCPRMADNIPTGSLDINPRNAKRPFCCADRNVGNRLHLRIEAKSLDAVDTENVLLALYGSEHKEERIACINWLRQYIKMGYTLSRNKTIPAE